MTYIIRPNIQCVFDIMNACHTIEDEDSRHACVEGARDAHLQPLSSKVYNDAASNESYVIGWNSAVVGCPHEATWS